MISKLGFIEGVDISAKAAGTRNLLEYDPERHWLKKLPRNGYHYKNLHRENIDIKKPRRMSPENENDFSNH